jgi:hypothetical protein
MLARFYRMALLAQSGGANFRFSLGGRFLQ